MGEDAQATDCKQPMWMNCIIDVYERHYIAKRYYGFYINNPGYRKNVYLY